MTRKKEGRETRETKCMRLWVCQSIPGVAENSTHIFGLIPSMTRTLALFPFSHELFFSFIGQSCNTWLLRRTNMQFETDEIAKTLFSMFLLCKCWNLIFFFVHWLCSYCTNFELGMQLETDKIVYVGYFSVLPRQLKQWEWEQETLRRFFSQGQSGIHPHTHAQQWQGWGWPGHGAER